MTKSPALIFINEKQTKGFSVVVPNFEITVADLKKEMKRTQKNNSVFEDCEDFILKYHGTVLEDQSTLKSYGLFNLASVVVKPVLSTLMSFIDVVLQLGNHGMGQIRYYKSGNRVVGYRMEKAIDAQKQNRINSDWYHGLHGTQAKNVPSIIEYGFHKSGDMVNGAIIQFSDPRHAGIVDYFGKFPNYSSAAFLANDPRLAMRYAEIIKSQGVVGVDDGEFAVLLECITPPGSFQMFGDICGLQGYGNDCKDSIDCYHIDKIVCRIEKPENIVVVAVVLLDEGFLTDACNRFHGDGDLKREYKSDLFYSFLKGKESQSK